MSESTCGDAKCNVTLLGSTVTLAFTFKDNYRAMLFYDKFLAQQSGGPAAITFESMIPTERTE